VFKIRWQKLMDGLRRKRRLNVRNRFLFLLDLFCIVVSVWGSYTMRFEVGAAFYFYLPFVYWMVGIALLVKPLIYYAFGLYRRVWIYASTQELKLIVVAVTAASGALALVMLGLSTAQVFNGYLRGVFVMDWALSLLLVGGVRFTLRLLSEAYNIPSNRSTNQKRVLIVGAGDAGALVVRELQKNPQLNLLPTGFLDDNVAKQHNSIHGVPVVGTLNDLANVLDNQPVDEVIIAIPSAPGKVVRLVADVCRLKGVPFRTMPGIYELLGGTVSVSRLREVDIADLLRREPVHVNDDRVGASLSGKVVLVTGAGGSIGRELCRQVARWMPSELVLLGHGENSIFETWLDLRDSFPSLSTRTVIADVRDRERIQMLWREINPQVVFHAAAHKHVPLMEVNPVEAITNNVMGTRNVVDASLEVGVERLVMISTDKAIRPANVMGATKRMAEMIVLDAAQRSGRSFSVVRFGNVLGSRGSVVPLFKRQIARGGPVTVTHPDMKRYFMTIPEAVYLVLQASAMGRSGDLFVLNMGQQVRILDLAEDLIRLSGLEPGRDIEIVYTGIRPGDKLSEDLWDEGFTFEKTDHPDIFRIESQEGLHGTELRQTVDELIHLAQEGDGTTAVSLMDEIIPGSAVLSTPPPDLTSTDS
jgi:FlaA1/EpsC-like NDP-sugar epimerase